MDFDDWMIWIGMGLCLLMLILFFIFSYNSQKEVCEDFGGKLTGDMNCYKNGNIYEIVNINNGFSNNYKVARYGASIE